MGNYKAQESLGHSVPQVPKTPQKQLTKGPSERGNRSGTTDERDRDGTSARSGCVGIDRSSVDESQAYDLAASWGGPTHHRLRVTLGR